MGKMASHITSLTIVYSTVYSGWNQRNHQSSVSLAFVCAGNSPVTGELLTQRSSNAENASIWLRPHGIRKTTFSQTPIWHKWPCWKTHEVRYQSGKEFKSGLHGLKSPEPTFWTDVKFCAWAYFVKYVACVTHVLIQLHVSGLWLYKIHGTNIMIFLA